MKIRKSIVVKLNLGDKTYSDVTLFEDVTIDTETDPNFSGKSLKECNKLVLDMVLSSIQDQRKALDELPLETYKFHPFGG